jgi:hypothetical protein
LPLQLHLLFAIAFAAAFAVAAGFSLAPLIGSLKNEAFSPWGMPPSSRPQTLSSPKSNNSLQINNIKLQKSYPSFATINPAAKTGLKPGF